MGIKREVIFSVFLLVFIIGIVGGVSAATTNLFYDNFDASSINTSKWTISNSNDVGLDNAFPQSPAGGKYMWIEDDADVTASVDTTSCNNIQFSYYRKTHLEGCSDKLRVYWRVGSSGSWTELESINSNSWVNKIWSLSGAQDKPLVQIKFFLDNGEGDKGYVDNVTITGDCTPPIFNLPPPTCSVDYLKDVYSPLVLNLSLSSAFSATGNFEVWGSADSNSGNCEITGVGYNRSSPGPYLIPSWKAASSQNAQFTIWKTDPNDNSFVNGVHTVCCRPISRSCVEGCSSTEGSASCKSFCLDTLGPYPVTGITNDVQDCVGTKVYSNSPCVSWSWDSATDNGCAGLDHYNVNLYYSNGTLINQTTTESTSVEFCDLANGQDYYISVNGVDNAGNPGTPTSSSEVIIDLVPPLVTITGPLTGPLLWYAPPFTVTETDTDTNLDKCYYQITDTYPGGNSTGWIQLTCSSPIVVDPAIYCPHDGDYCHVNKKATDKACNVGIDREVTFQVDTHPPNISKTVGNPKVSPTTDYWINLLVNNGLIDDGFFIRNITEITLTCNDGSGSGVNATYYRVNGGTWILYNGPFTLSPDGIKNLEYYCVDNVGKQSDTGSETDKVDDVPPVTVKTIGTPQYNDSQGRLWVNSSTLFKLNATDSEVGCQNINYLITYEGDAPIQGDTDSCLRQFYLQGPDGAYNVLYSSIDKLGNIEGLQSEIDYLDNTPPEIIIHNPTNNGQQVTESISRCDQSIVVEVKDIKSGVNESSIYAELINSTGSVVRTVLLVKAVNQQGLQGGIIFYGMMDKQLPAGNYVLKVFATDNVGNGGWRSVTEKLEEGIYVEYIGPSTCNINAGESKNCIFTFNVCARNVTTIDFCMSKLGKDPELVVPYNLNAVITNDDQDLAYVGLCGVSNGNPKDLLLDNGNKVNGKTTFDLTLSFTSNITSILGTGSYDLNYTINAFDP